MTQPRSQAPEYGGTAFDIAFQTEPARVTQPPSIKPSINMSALFGSIAVSSVMTCCVIGKIPIVCLPVCLLACLSACLSVCLPFCLPACLSVCLLACLLACLSVCVPVRLLACLPVCLPACLPACLSACPYVCLPA